MIRYTDLICPATRLPLAVAPLAEARAAISDGLPLTPRRLSAGRPAPIGETETVLVRADARAAYPILSGVPILLAPEVLTAPNGSGEFDLSVSHYAEAYSEMAFYDDVAAAEIKEIRQAASLRDVSAESIQHLGRLLETPEGERHRFPHPRQRWLYSRIDFGAQWDCCAHLAPVIGNSVLQLGGKGTVALTLLLAGADAATLITPMMGEALLALELAAVLNLTDRFRCIIGLAEEIPLPDASIDGLYSGGSVHHMTTEKAFPEMARVLRAGGKLAAIEPWRAPLYALGTRIFGKREPNAFCRPLTRSRIAPLFTAFPNSRCVHHGTFTRYPMIVLEKFGARMSVELAWRLGKLDDGFCALIPGLRDIGSGVALLATK